MAFKILYKKSVFRDLKKLDKPVARRIMQQIEKELVKDPELNPSLKGEFAGLRKFRVGDYRVVYTIIDDEVIILRVGHRKSVYR